MTAFKRQRRWQIISKVCLPSKAGLYRKPLTPPMKSVLSPFSTAFRCNFAGMYFVGLYLWPSLLFHRCWDQLTSEYRDTPCTMPTLPTRSRRRSMPGGCRDRAGSKARCPSPELVCVCGRGRSLPSSPAYQRSSAIASGLPQYLSGGSVWCPAPDRLPLRLHSRQPGQAHYARCLALQK